VEHPHADAIEPIAVSSLPDHGDVDARDRDFDEDSAGSLSDLDEALGASARPTPNDDLHRVVRFRPVLSGTNPERPPARTNFRPASRDGLPELSPHGPVLPDIFSPSRRKGKKDYISGGSAELVRSWILAIPAQESHLEALAEDIFLLIEVSHDGNGRFATADAHDGSRWLFPEQGGQVFSRSSRSLASLVPGAKVLIKGRATRWNLNLPSGSVTVAAYWEVLPSG
jgi:hypothetical protein